MSFLFWFVAVGALALAWLIYAAVGVNPVSSGLLGLAIVAGLAGHVADLVARS